MTVATIVLQRREPGPRADALLEALQESVPESERTRWNDSGHARLVAPTQVEDPREAVAARLERLGDDWADHIAIL
jgi:hypothetical protein